MCRSLSVCGSVSMSDSGFGSMCWDISKEGCMNNHVGIFTSTISL